jgi:hypothetical protein
MDPTTPGEEIQRAFALVYWRPDSFLDAIALSLGLLLLPFAVLAADIWFTLRNGPAIRSREGKGLRSQFAEQIRLYFTAGIYGPWYYILSLHRDGSRRAPTYLQRCMTKRGVYGLLRPYPGSPLGDKRLFAEWCAHAGVRCVACEGAVGDGLKTPCKFPNADLFLKPLGGRGGKGAERWDRVTRQSWSNGKEVLGPAALLHRLRAKRRPFIVQKRVKTHPALKPLTSGALPTVRVLTIIDEHGVPEIAAAVFRMSIGTNRLVDNFHAGGIACAVSLDSGTLGIASNLGSDSRLGWTSRHPTTGVRIEGTQLPFWNEVKLLAAQAHRAFADRVMVGWDIGIAKDGPILIEGNSGPDLDVMQRFMETGFCHEHRFSELIAHHLRARRSALPGMVKHPSPRSPTRAPRPAA